MSKGVALGCIPNLMDTSVVMSNEWMDGVGAEEVRQEKSREKRKPAVSFPVTNFLTWEDQVFPGQEVEGQPVLEAAIYATASPTHDFGHRAAGMGKQASRFKEKTAR
jgi:hypothetical protein